MYTSPQNAFISLDHDDDQYARDIRSIEQNLNNYLSFIDTSLLTPVKNECDHIIKSLPNNPKASAVCSKINELLQQSSVMIVIAGQNTHSSTWVDYEISQFMKLKGRHRIIAMRTPNVGDWGFPFLDKHGIKSFSWCIDTLTFRLNEIAR